MWRKKSDDIIQKEQRENERSNLKERSILAIKLGLGGFIGGYLLNLITALTLGTDYNPIFPPDHGEIIALYEIPKYNYKFINSGVFFGIAMFLAAFVVPKIFSKNTDSMKCDKCFNVKNFDDKNKCDCGGTFYPLSYYEWINDDEI
ncbi:hypothetical protein SLH46_06525 [Draconibacterium sp. IB214405]|uniref:hypothetical protein n=1 Tax=Draconibacterium sp. IB214405 TaxID=3097352 RepID=UPI002A0B2498|nr:hypothetical protein [Draconibacterium sp. IB214405]MDX8338828.1 hypothetical protein [Draconibacterium sp. IB214405]